METKGLLSAHCPAPLTCILPPGHQSPHLPCASLSLVRTYDWLRGQPLDGGALCLQNAGSLCSRSWHSSPSPSPGLLSRMEPSCLGFRLDASWRRNASPRASRRFLGLSVTSQPRLTSPFQPFSHFPVSRGSRFLKITWTETFISDLLLQSSSNLI